MRKALPTVAAAILVLSGATASRAEESNPQPSHPADTNRVFRPLDTIQPFEMAVPLLNRDAPMPSYRKEHALSGAGTVQPDSMPEMDHGNMPGMDHSNMPGMSGN